MCSMHRAAAERSRFGLPGIRLRHAGTGAELRRNSAGQPIGGACRLRQAIAAAAAQNRASRCLQVDSMADGNEDRSHAVARTQHRADDLAPDLEVGCATLCARPARDTRRRGVTYRSPGQDDRARAPRGRRARSGAGEPTHAHRRAADRARPGAFRRPAGWLEPRGRPAGRGCTESRSRAAPWRSRSARGTGTRRRPTPRWRARSAR